MLFTMTFDQAGITIDDPTMDETGRFRVNPYDHYKIKDYKFVTINGHEILIGAHTFNEILKSITEFYNDN